MIWSKVNRFIILKGSVYLFQNVAEFADIWSQLQAAVPPGGTDTGPSLNQAAQVCKI